MPETAAQELSEPAPPTLAEILALHESGRTLSAWRLGREAFGPLLQWQGIDARVLAARLLDETGAPRASSFLRLQTWRAHRRDPVAAYYAAVHILQKRGPVDALRFMHRFGAPEPAAPHWRASWWALRARALSLLRDFDAADRALRAAADEAPEDAWVEAQRAGVLQAEDRYADALAAAERALALRPLYRPAIQTTAYMLQLVGRDLDALGLLRDRAAQLESAALVEQLAGLETELGAHAEARQNLLRLADLWPEMDVETFRRLQCRLSDVAWECGDLDGALEHARNSQSPFHQRIVERVEKKGREGRRAEVPIAFVRQHHQTCVPATLSAISAHWKLRADHLQLAEEICYDGTPAQSERRWAERSGWAVREFRLTWEAAVALVDRGAPFTLTTVSPGNGHMQAVFGYDERRGTIAVRDPTFPNRGEINVEGFLEAQKVTGPRCMAMVPRAESHRLDGVPLEDAALYDQLYAVDCALVEHRRDRAGEILDEMGRIAPDHRVTLQARRALAAYDSDDLAGLQCVEAALAQHPGDANLILGKSWCLQRLGRKREAQELLGNAAKEREPLLWVALAEMLSADAQQHDAAGLMLRKAIHADPSLARAYKALADLRWIGGRRDEAIDLYRYAACLDDKNEQNAWSFFVAARHFQRTDEALAFLQGRYQRFGGKAGWPARTLFQALDVLDRTDEAFRLLAAAVQLRPDDGELLLFAADVHARFGRTSQARQLLDAAANRVKRSAWQRQSAALAGYCGEPRSALEQWLAILESEPLAIDAHENAVRLLADVRGVDAAIAHLDEAAARFPHHMGILRLRLEWLRPRDPVRAIEAGRQFCNAQPADAWARREVTLALLDLGRNEEAEAEIEAAVRIDPNAIGTMNIRGLVFQHLSRIEEARAWYRQSLRKEIDGEWPMDALLRTCSTNAERAAELAFIREELDRQVLFANAPTEYQRLAARVLPPEEVLAHLSALLEKNRGLLPAWLAVVRQFVLLQRLEPALETAKAAAERFPLVPDAWLELASVHALRREANEEKASIGRALGLAPGSTAAARRLGAAYTREGKHEKAREILERGIAASPGAGDMHVSLAETLDRLGDRDAAVAHVEQALRLDPSPSAWWDTLVEWNAGRARSLAQEIAAQRPRSAEGWLGLARALPASALQERLDALTRAAEASPRYTEVYDLRAQLLAQAGRFDEAAAACSVESFGDLQPVMLRGRAIWVVAERGDLRGAVEQMRALLVNERGYRWGHRQLIEWSRKLGDSAQLLAAGEQLASAYPQDAYGHGVIGEALADKDRARARAALSTAFTLDPTYDWAGETLFDLEMTGGDLQAAAVTLARLQQHHPSDPYVAARAVELACRRRNAAEAERQLATICDEKSLPNAWPIQFALDEMRRALYGARARSIVEARVLAGTTSPTVAAEWATRADGIRLWAKLWRLDEKLRMEAVRAYVTRLRKSVALLPFVLWYRRALAADAQLWGTVGYALYEGGSPRLACRWLSRSRPADAEPWMLINLICAQSALGRAADADRSIAAARALRGADAEPKILAWSALRAGLHGQVENAREELVKTAPLEEIAFYKFLRRQIEALVAADAATAIDRLDAALAVYPTLGRLARKLQVRVFRAVRLRFPRAMPFRLRLREWFW